MKKFLILIMIACFASNAFSMDSVKTKKFEFKDVKELLDPINEDVFQLKGCRVKNFVICLFRNFEKSLKEVVKEEKDLGPFYEKMQEAMQATFKDIKLEELPKFRIDLELSALKKKLKKICEENKNQKTNFVFYAFEFIVDILKYMDEEDLEE
jgi:hypothetical protein